MARKIVNLEIVNNWGSVFTESQVIIAIDLFISLTNKLGSLFGKGFSDKKVFFTNISKFEWENHIKFLLSLLQK